MLEILIAALAVAQVNLPGTQPNTLGLQPEPSSACNCHLSFAGDTFTEPGQTYRSTMMALSARDPLFRAALKVAHQDRPDASDLCIRCHAPLGWLGGRSTPGDGSLLTEDDLESVSCDMCHRQISSIERPELIGSGQYTIHGDTTKRARRGNGPDNGHMVEASDFIGSSELCGKCHSLFNPLESAHDFSGRNLGFAYYEQRTYEEWADSSFAIRGESCISCHMKKVTGKAARQGYDTYTDLAQHMIVGGNDWIPQYLAATDPYLEPIVDDIPYLVAAVKESLESAVTLEVTNATTSSALTALGGDEIDLDVRLTNRTGHKLPTGYPEGRRVYLEVMLQVGAVKTVISGAWDPATGKLIEDEQLRTYETEHGRYENGVSERTHDLIEMNQVITDTRIPPEGFTPHAADMIPAGRDYGSTAPYRHWDEHTYRIPLPAVTAASTGTISVRALYMITDGEVVEFLVSRAGAASVEGVALQDAFDMFDRVPPSLMAEVKIPLEIYPRPASADGGTADGAPVVIPVPEDSGCSCAAAEPFVKKRYSVFLALAVLFLAKRRRVR